MTNFDMYLRNRGSLHNISMGLSRLLILGRQAGIREGSSGGVRIPDKSRLDRGHWRFADGYFPAAISEVGPMRSMEVSYCTLPGAIP